MANSILLVEDEIGKDLQYFLEEAGHVVILYQNGRKALEEIQNGLMYQLAIIDLSLPLYGGDELIEASKRLNPQVPVISISGYDVKPRASDQHILKPIWLDDLVAIINSYLPNESAPKK